jgi:hypothetical protein
MAMEHLPSQRYVFAHRMLPRVLWWGDALLGALANPEDTTFLAERWDHIGVVFQCRASGGRAELTHTSRWIGGDNLAMVVTMPRPVESAEAYFSVITSSPVLRYFTLEREGDWVSRDSDQESPPETTILGESMPDGSHVNFGAGPKPDLVQFLQAVCGILGLPPTVEEPTLAQRQGLSREGPTVLLAPAMDPDDLAALKEREAEAERLEWDSQPAPAFERYHAAIQEFFARYAEPPTEITLLYAGAIRCLKAMGHLETAEIWARQWWALVRRFRMLGHAEAMMASRMVAELLVEQGRSQEAEALYRHRVLLAGLARGKGSVHHEEALQQLERFTTQR